MHGHPLIPVRLETTKPFKHMQKGMHRLTVDLYMDDPLVKEQDIDLMRSLNVNVSNPCMSKSVWVLQIKKFMALIISDK